MPVVITWPSGPGLFAPRTQKGKKEMIILVINAGSSSVKFSLFDLNSRERFLAGGVVERIGLEGTRFSWTDGAGRKTADAVDVGHTRDAIGVITACIVDPANNLLDSLEAVTAVGHRVVHGGEYVREAVVIDAGVKTIVKDCFTLAPLHNPPNLRGIEACEEVFPKAVQVAVFDTAFHATLPERAYLYALPLKFYHEDKIRRYGFHGTSHQFVCEKLARHLSRSFEELKIVSCHLGNGSSITAIDGGRSVDTSMGMTPLEGTIMGSRCGDTDPAIVFHLMKTKGMTPDRVSKLLNSESGMLGLAGVGSSDLRDITKAADAGNRQARTAIDVYAYRVRKYIGAYAFAMGGLDAVIFTAGIGENSALIRQKVCQGLDGLGIVLDPDRNIASAEGDRAIHDHASQVAVWIIPTDEEKAIAGQVLKVLAGGPEPLHTG